MNMSAPQIAKTFQLLHFHLYAAVSDGNSLG